MISQVSMEAVYSATYVENYLDCVENLPDELQRLISRMRELDVYYIAHVREAKSQSEIWKNAGENAGKKARAFVKMQTALIAAQELGDEKMQLVQSIQDKIEVKVRLLDQDFKNLDFGKEETSSCVETKEQQQSVSSTNALSNTNNTNNSNSNNSGGGGGERGTKRARRTRHDTFSGMESNHNESSGAEHLLRSQVAGSAGAAAKKNANAAGKGGKKKKRKSRQSAQQHHQQQAAAAASAGREETPPREEETAIDPDEPTYCLCDQISFGEMIMCDNDLCPMEWFHFSCVSLTTKPKGKWFCPKCRGDKPNVMKPKAQFLKELERYNREKEEKT